MSTQTYLPDLPRFLQKRRVRRNVTRILVTLTDLAFRNLSASVMLFEMHNAAAPSNGGSCSHSTRPFYFS